MGRVSVQGGLPDRDTPRQRPYSGQRPPWTETALWTKTPGQRSPGQRPLEGDLPGKNMGPLTEIPEGPWDQGTDTPFPERTWDQADRQKLTSYRDPLPLPVDRMTDTRLWKYYLAPMFLCGRSQLLCLHNYSSFTTRWMTHLWVTKYCVHRLRWF